MVMSIEAIGSAADDMLALSELQEVIFETASRAVDKVGGVDDFREAAVRIQHLTRIGARFAYQQYEDLSSLGEAARHQAKAGKA